LAAARPGGPPATTTATATAIVLIVAGLLGSACGRLPRPPLPPAAAPAGGAGAVATEAPVGPEALAGAVADGLAAGAGPTGPAPGDAVAAPGSSAVAAPVRWSGPLPAGAVAVAVGATRPVRVRVAALGLDAPVVAAGVAGDGRLELPGDAVTVAWFQGGAVPGDSGSAVLAAHVDYAGRPGAFFDLADLVADSVIEVTLADGTVRDFRTVGGARTHAKGELPVPELFRRGGLASLTLVTCGGAFDPASRSYADNTLVSAAPTTPPTASPAR
jgi:hypothetical protein